MGIVAQHMVWLIHIFQYTSLNLPLIETPFNTFANRADQDQAALERDA